ncbi:bifunctional riboflavin kinase/fmn phosphatase [Quercus suber]|uniref:Bifunctional riboflavin kinase/fmn phosphatase n=1 Tax=Quercus suber TaxID=58331 RepID=A0AAW0M8F2_QUESU
MRQWMRDIILITTVYRQNFVEPLADLLWILMIFLRRNLPLWLQAKPLPGANRLMKHLHKHGVPFALASNSLREYIDVKISLQKGWKEYFSVILGSDQVKSGKPSPDL